MIELNKKTLVLNLLNERISDSTYLPSLFQLFNPNRQGALESFKKWKSRTNKVIRKYVSHGESDTFWDLKTNCIYGFPTNQHLCTFAAGQVSGHIEFVKSLVDNIYENYTYISNETIIEWTYYILMRLYNSKKEGKYYIKIEALVDIMSLPVYEVQVYLEQLLPLQMIEIIGNFGSLASITLTDKGSKEYTKYLQKINADKDKERVESEKMIEKTYAENELFVLNTIYTMGKNSPMQAVMVSDLAKALRMSYPELNEYLNELENRKGLVEGFTDESVRVTPKGKEFLQGKSNLPNASSVNHIYNTNINAPSNNQIGGSNNTLIGQIHVNPEFSSAIESIASLIKDSSLVDYKKEDLYSTIELIKKLQESKPSAELAEHGKSKVNYLELVVKGSDIALKLAPHIQTLYHYFEHFIRNSAS